MSSDHDNRNAPRPGAGDPPDSGAEFSRAKVFWYSPALNAFFDLNSADYKLLLLFLGIYGTEDPAKAAATVERALRDPLLAEAARRYPARASLAKRRLTQLTYELLDGGYALFPGGEARFKKNETYGKNARLARKLPWQAVPYYTEVLAWLFAEDRALLAKVLGKLRVELARFHPALPELPEEDSVPALAQAAAETLYPLLRLLAYRAAGPRAACPLLAEAPPRTGSSREAACYLQLLDSCPSDTFSFYEGLSALAQQGNPYALRELAAICRSGRRFSLYGGGQVTIAPDPGYAARLAQEARTAPSPSQDPDARPIPLHPLYRPFSREEQPEPEDLAALADRGSLEAAWLLAQRETDPAARAALLQALRASPLWSNALKDYTLTETGSLTPRAEGDLLPLLLLFAQPEDAPLLRRLGPALRTACRAQDLLALADCYARLWPDWSLARKRAHKAPLCLLLPALLEAQQQLQQEQLRFHVLEGRLAPEEARARRKALRELEDRLLDAQFQVRAFLLESLDAGPAQPSEPPQLDDSLAF